MLGNDMAFQAYYNWKVDHVRAPVEAYIPWLHRSVASLMQAAPPKLRLNRNPYILTAAIVYLADQLNAQRSGSKRVLTQQVLAGAVGVAEYSLRDVYCQLKAYLTEQMFEAFTPITLPGPVVKRHVRRRQKKRAAKPVLVVAKPVAVVTLVAVPPVIIPKPAPVAKPQKPLSDRKMICKVCGEVVSKKKGCKRCIVENPEAVQLPLPFKENALFRMEGQRA